MLLAEGAVDIATEPDLELYDMAALDVIVREAGGFFTSLNGEPGPTGGSALATNGTQVFLGIGTRWVAPWTETGEVLVIGPDGSRATISPGGTRAVLDGGGTRQLSDTLLARLKSGVVIIGRKDEGKVGIIVRVSDDLTGKVKAGDIIREIAPIVGGRGGGKPDMAEGGGTEPSKLNDAIEASYEVIGKMLG
jgi:hypothetical protein